MRNEWRETTEEWEEVTYLLHGGPHPGPYFVRRRPGVGDPERITYGVAPRGAYLHRRGGLDYDWLSDEPDVSCRHKGCGLPDRLHGAPDISRSTYSDHWFNDEAPDR